MLVLKGSPANSFITMAIANFMATFVFGMLYLFHTNDEGERYMLLLLATCVLLFSGILMIVLYGYFQKRLEEAKKISGTKNPSRNS
ncbi:MAG: hypothetical protein J4G05_10220 [Chlorobi bacterium]|nr:hypothetical protein [Chlorobiota bacterium]